MPGYRREGMNCAFLKRRWRKRQVYIERMLEEWNKDAEM